MAEGLRKKVAALHDAGELEGIIAINALSEVQRCDTIFYSINPGGHSIRLNEISLKVQRDLPSLPNEDPPDGIGRMDCRKYSHSASAEQLT